MFGWILLAMASIAHTQTASTEFLVYAVISAGLWQFRVKFDAAFCGVLAALCGYTAYTAQAQGFRVMGAVFVGYCLFWAVLVIPTRPEKVSE